MSTDAPQLPKLTKRQEDILSLIIRAYSQKPEAVSSKLLVDSFDLSISSATVRNEMSVLEELGYIGAPHTSAGRIPTELGYRYFVRHIIKESDLQHSEQKHIIEKFQSLPLATEQWMRLAATVLARTSNTASLVTPPIAESSRFKHVELVAIQGRLVLMVLVLQGGIVHQRMLNLAEPVPQARLSEIASHLSTLCLDLYPNQIHLKSLQLPVLEREIIELVVEVMQRSDSNPVRVIYRDGLSDIITNFPDSEGQQQAVRVFEERAFLEMILADFFDPLMTDVRVIVAGDGRWEEMNHISMVLGRYGVPGQMSGAIGVLGPTHLNYGRAISSVRYISSLMTNMLIELYNEGKSNDDEMIFPSQNDKS